MTKKNMSTSSDVDFNIIGQLIAGLAIELEKIAPPSVQSLAEKDRTSVRRYLAREIANDIWAKKGFSLEWKSLRLQFLQQQEPYISKAHRNINPENIPNVKDIERWAFNDFVEFWAQNSEKENVGE